MQPIEGQERNLDSQLVEVVAVQRSTDGTVKLIQAVNTGPIRATFETVRLFTAGEEKVNLSSQFGCDMGCTFCARPNWTHRKDQ